MNAPWNPERSKSAAREPFAGFVCDDATAAAGREAAAALGWAVDSVGEGGLTGAVAALAAGASPTLLLVDLSDAGDPMAELGALAEVCEPGTVVVACGATNDVSLYRALIASGIQDYLVKPLSADMLRDAFAGAQVALAAPKAAEPEVAKPRLGVTIIGARGGVGASSLAASLAWSLAEKHKRQTALLDLDLHFGTGALNFDLEPGRGLVDALENPGRIDALFIQRAMVKAGERLSVLSAEASIALPLGSDGVALHHLQEEMRGAFDAVVVDLPRTMAVEHPHLIAEAGHIVVVAEQTLACTRDSIRLLGWLKSAAPTAKISVVANRVPGNPPPEVSAKDFEASIERKIDLSLPLDMKLAGTAARGGKCLAAVSGGSKLGSGLAQFTALALGEEVAAKETLGGKLKAFLAKKA